MTRGSTLLELVVVLAIMGVVAGVVTLSLPPSRVNSAPDTFARAQREAIATRRPHTIAIVRDGVVHDITVLPDGGVLADSTLRIDRLTGERSDAQ